MKESITNSAYFGIALTILTYYIGIRLSRKFKHPLLNALLISCILIVGILIFFDIEYKYYNNGAKFISYLLNTATICLAIPLYEHLVHLKNNWLAIISGIISGVVASSISILSLAILFSLNHEQYVTLLPKSITAAIGIGISESLGGMSTLTVAVIILTGLVGNIFGEFILKLFRINNPIAKGVALGSSAHALGTSRALEIGELEGAISSLSLAVSGLLTVVFASLFAQFI